MNTNENPQNTAILNQLILLVLSLILVCLVLLVVRAYTNPADEPDAQRASVGEGPAPAEEPFPVIFDSPPRPQPPPVRRSATNVVRAAPAPAPVPPPTSSPASESPNAGAVSFVGVSGAGVPRIAPIGGAETGGIAPVSVNTDIIGVATLLGTPPPEMPIDMGPACGRINPRRVTTRHYVVNPEGRLANVFVYIKVKDRLSYDSSSPPSPVLLDQVGCMYEPYVFGLQMRQQFHIRNSDPEMHNVHSMPKVEGNEEFNFAQRKGQENVKSFPKPEVFVRMKCDVHPWMFAYIGVVSNPFFAVTDTNGVFRLPAGLHAGKFMLTATHLRAGTLSQEIDFRPGEQKVLQFQFVVPEPTQAQNTGARRTR